MTIALSIYAIAVTAFAVWVTCHAYCFFTSREVWKKAYGERCERVYKDRRECVVTNAKVETPVDFNDRFVVSISVNRHETIENAVDRRIEKESVEEK